MANGGTAGRSAADKAQRYQELSDRWQRGADGERLTAEALAPLGDMGFRVFHDLRVPGSKANIDHLVIGPTGVFAVDSKNHRSRLSYNKDTLWAGRYPQTEKLRRSRWEADQAAAVLGGAPVVAVQCVHGAAVPALDGPVEGVHVVDADGLRALVTGSPPALSAAQCADLVSTAVAAWSTWEPAGTRPMPRGPRPARRPERSVPGAARGPRRAERSGPVSARTAPVGRKTRRRQPVWAALVEVVLMVVFCWLLLAKGLPALSDAIVDTLPTTTTTTTAPPP